MCQRRADSSDVIQPEFTTRSEPISYLRNEHRSRIFPTLVKTTRRIRKLSVSTSFFEFRKKQLFRSASLASALCCHLAPSSIPFHEVGRNVLSRAVDYVTTFDKALPHSGEGSIIWCRWCHRFGCESYVRMWYLTSYKISLTIENNGITISSNVFFFPLFFLLLFSYDLFLNLI